MRNKLIKNSLISLLSFCVAGSLISLLFGNTYKSEPIEVDASTAASPIAEYYFNSNNPEYEVNQKSYLTSCGSPTGTGTSGAKGWVTFDGVDDALVSSGYNSDSNPANPFYRYASSDISVAFEFKVNSVGSWGFPISFYEGGDIWSLNKGFVGFMLDPGGNLRFADYAYNSNPSDPWWSPYIIINSMTAGTAYKIVVSIDKDGKTNIYVDGVNKYSQNTHFNEYTRTGSDWSMFRLGGHQNSAGSFNKGDGGNCYCPCSFRNLYIYNRALSSKEAGEYTTYDKLIDHIQPAYVFNNNMILQRNTSVKVYGWDGTVGRTVTVSFAGQNKNASPQSNGYWCATLDPMNANATGQTLTISDGVDTFNFTNVRVGEVWYAGGQSNMEWSFGEFLENRGYASATVWSGGVDISKTDFAEYLNYTNYSNIAIYKQDYLSSTSPSKLGKQNTYMKNGWAVPSSFNSVLGYSAYAVGFVLRLQEGLGDVPVGLVLSSYRGSSVEEWISQSTWNTYNLHSHYDGKGKDKFYLYNGMEYPLKDFQVKGLLWYQGCADSGYGDETTSWVNDWGNDMIALAHQFRSTHGSNAAIICQQLVQHDDWVPWQYIRQKAWDLMSQIDNFYTVAGIGAGLMHQLQLPDTGNFIHPADKYGISKDAGNIALTKVYNKSGFNGLAQYPEKAYISNGKFYIEFRNNASLFLKSGSTVNNLVGYNASASVWETVTGATVSGNKIVINSTKNYTGFAYGQYNLMYPKAKSDPTNSVWKGYTMHPDYNSDSIVNLYSNELNGELAVAPFSYVGVKPDDSLVKNSTLLSTVAFISDTHWRNGSDYGDTFVKNAIADINSLASSGTKFDAVINLGDMSDTGVDSSKVGYNSLSSWYDYVATNPVKNKNNSVVPFYSVLGNHDVRGDIDSSLTDPQRQNQFVTAARLYQQREIYNGWGADKTGAGSYSTSQTLPDLLYYTEIGGFHYVFINTYQYERDACRLTQANLTWIDNTLTTLENSDGNKPIFLINHQPLDYQNNSVYVVGDSTGYAFEEMLSHHRTTIYCSGHTHRPLGINHIFQDISIGGHTVANYINIPSLEYNGYSDYAAYGVSGYTTRSVSSYTNVQYYVCEIYENGVIFKARDAQENKWVESSYMVVNNKGTVTFKNDNGSTISSHQYKYGETVEAPELENRTGYTASWNKTVKTTCQGDETYTAVYTANKYPVSFGNITYGTAFLSSSKTATSGSASGTSFNYGSKVYCFVTLNSNTDQYSYLPQDGWTLVNGRTYRVGELTVGVSGNSFGNYSGTRTLNSYAVNFATNTNVKNTYTALDSNATSGNTSGHQYAYGTRVYEFVTLNDDTDQYSYLPQDGWSLVSGRTYRVNSLNVGTSNNFAAVSANRTINSYTVNWYDETGENILKADTNVDYGTVPNYGESPSKADYNFVGWSDTVGGEIISSLPAVTGDVNYYAVFEEKPTYTITFINYDDSVIDSIEIKEGHIPSTEVVPSKEGNEQYSYTFDGWSLTNGGDKLDALPAVSEDATYYAHYQQSVNKYDIHFVNYNDEELATYNLEYGTTITYNGDTPTKASDAQYSYTFAGWDHALTTVSGEDTFVAQFTPAIRSYTVSFNLQDKGSAIDAQVIQYGEKVSKPNNPVENGYLFDDWYTEPGCNNKWNFNENVISGDTVLYAKWIDIVITIDDEQNVNTDYSINEHNVLSQVATVTNDLDLVYTLDEASVANGFTNNGNTIVVPAGKTSGNYVITFTITEPLSHEQTTSTINLTINKIDPTYNAPTAKTNLEYTSNPLALINAGTSDDGIILYSLDNETFNEGIPTATNPNTYHVYWKLVGDENHNDVSVNSIDVTIYEKLCDYTVNHYQEQLNGDYVLDKTEVFSGAADTYTEAVSQIYEGFNAQAFEQVIIKLDGTTVIDIRYSRNLYTVTLINNNGEENTVIEDVKYGTSASCFYEEDLIPSKVGHTFDGWYFDDIKITENNVVENNVTLEARFNVGIYNIVYHLDDAEIEGEYPTTYQYGEGATLPTLVNKTGYTFEGWFINESFEGDVITVISETSTNDVNVYAKLSINSYHIIFFDENEEKLFEIDLDYGSETTYVGEVPTKTGDAQYSYTFVGWSLTKDGELLKELPTVDGDINFYAIYEASTRTYTITYVLNGGTINGDKATTYTYGTGVQLPTSLTKDGYNFVGWYSNEDLSGGSISSIRSSDYGDKTFYAKWEIEEVINPTYYVNILDTEHGTISCDVDEFNADEEIVITITPDKGYEIAEVLINEIDFTNNVNGNELVISIDDDIEVEVTFRKTKSSSAGCGSSIESASLIISLISSLMLGLVLFRRLRIKKYED